MASLLIITALGFWVGWKMCGWFGLKAAFRGIAGCVVLGLATVASAQNNFAAWSPATGTGTLSSVHVVNGFVFPLGMTVTGFQVAGGIYVDHPVWLASLNSGTNLMQGTRYHEAVFLGLDSAGKLALWMDGPAGTWGPLYEAGTTSFASFHDFNSTTPNSVVLPSGWASGGKLRMTVGFEAVSLAPTSMPTNYTSPSATTHPALFGTLPADVLSPYLSEENRARFSDAALPGVLSGVGSIYTGVASVSVSSDGVELSNKVNHLLGILMPELTTGSLVSEGAPAEAGQRAWINAIFPSGDGVSGFGSAFASLHRGVSFLNTNAPVVMGLVSLLFTVTLCWGFFWFHFHSVVWALGLKPGGVWAWIESLWPFGWTDAESEKDVDFWAGRDADGEREAWKSRMEAARRSALGSGGDGSDDDD